jgi:hypothetical protein
MVTKVIRRAGESIARCSLTLQKLGVAIEHLEGRRWPRCGSGICAEGEVGEGLQAGRHRAWSC